MTDKRKWISALALAVLAMLTVGGARSRAAATVVFVDSLATGSNDGSTWENAYTQLSSALAAAAPNSEVWVATGVYSPGITSADTFSLLNDVGVFGGFAGNETDRSQRDPLGNPTTLTGQSRVRHVVSAISVGSTAVLDGFTITGGRATGTGNENNGGGIFNQTSNATFGNLVVRGNRAENIGGGIANISGAPTFTDVVIEANSSAEGGGVGTLGGGGTSTTITRGLIARNITATTGGGVYTAGVTNINDSTIIGNRAGDGGGIGDSGGDSFLNRVLIANNVATSKGGAAFENVANSNWTNVTVYGNRAAQGGGVYNDAGSLLYTHLTFVKNRATTSAGAFRNSNGQPILRASIAWDNGAAPLVEIAGGNAMDLRDSIIQEGCPVGATCAAVSDDDPLLTVLADNGGESRTAGLAPTSPAIDALSTCVTGLDQRSVARPVDGDKDGSAACDYGALEFTPAVPSVGFASATASGTEATTSVSIPVQISTSALQAVTVDYVVKAGSARVPADFTTSSGTVTFPALTTAAQHIAFTVTNDRFHESSETVVVTLSSPAGATLGTATLVYTILDDDPRVRCRGRDATIIGTGGNDTLTGTNGGDVIAGLGGNDTIAGNGGDDLVCGGAGNDSIDGGNGNDTLRGEGGNDRLTGGPGVDLLLGAAGLDRLAGGGSTGDACIGGPGVDALLPNAGCEVTASVP